MVISIAAQFFDAFTADKRFFSGGKGGSGGGLGGLFGGAGGGSGYGAPTNSYGPPQQQPTYGNKPSYNNQQKPSYNNKPSYGGGGGKGGLTFKNIELPVPDIPIPDPIEFKAGVLRSKGRIASGLLHAKAGILRAGANILGKQNMYSNAVSIGRILGIDLEIGLSFASHLPLDVLCTPHSTD